MHDNMTWRGELMDKYNRDAYPNGGFAIDTKRRFEAMFRRGNPVRLEWRDFSYEGVITACSFNIIHRWTIEYEFTTSVHLCVDDDESPAQPETSLSADALTGEKDEFTALVESMNAAQPPSMAGSIAEDVDEMIANVVTESIRVDETISLRTLGTSVEPLDALQRIGSAFRATADAANTATSLLNPLRSDTALGYQTAIQVLTFESWVRGTAYACRRLVSATINAARSMEKRRAPDAIAIYRPYRGESMYDISRRFYQTPFAWRIISERNNLSDWNLTGSEILIIPEWSPG
jgi:hypothetical protein